MPRRKHAEPVPGDWIILSTATPEDRRYRAAGLDPSHFHLLKVDPGGGGEVRTTHMAEDEHLAVIEALAHSACTPPSRIWWPNELVPG